MKRSSASIPPSTSGWCRFGPWIRAPDSRYVLYLSPVKIATTKAQAQLFFTCAAGKNNLACFRREEPAAVARDLG